MNPNVGNLYKVFIFTFYGLCSGLGLILLKMAVSDTHFTIRRLVLLAYDIKFLLGFGLYATGFLLWLLILSKFRLNVAFPIAMSIFFTISSLGSYFILSEPFDLKHVLGILFCFFGILLVGLK